MEERFDVIVLGGGPAGSTVATLLASRGQRVVVVEKDHFPRFHIGESLLPASVGIFNRLGVHQQIREHFILKPGGKWLYGADEVPGDFSKSDRHAGFKDHPYSYLVERSVFDKILIDRSSEVGADVRFGTEAVDLIHDGDRVVGVSCLDENGTHSELYGRLIVDATGLRATIPSKLRLRQVTQPHRMGIYAQYAARPTRSDVQQGWFIGQMFYDGWTWLLNLPGDRFSVGVVLGVDRFRRSCLSPEQLLERMVDENPLLNEGMTPDRKRISDVMVTGNMGSTSTALSGEGWVAVGDAAFFIDPCYSSGVHLALKSAETVSDIILGLPGEQPVPRRAFAGYESEMRQHESAVHRMVDAFYIATRNTSVQKLVTSLHGGYLTRKFVTFVGGDFDKNAGYIRMLWHVAGIWARLFGNRSDRTPQTHPEYLHAGHTSVMAPVSEKIRRDRTQRRLPHGAVTDRGETGV